jgi:hypothetical protein
MKDPFGMRNPSAKLTDDQVRYIRVYAPIFTQRALAEKFNVSQAEISNVIRYKNWRTVK